jgi:hypothetical protein
MDFDEFTAKYENMERGELLNSFFELYKTQSGVDKKVKEYQQENAELQQKLETFGENGGSLVNAANQLKEREKLIELREAGIEYAIENNVSPRIGAMLAAENETKTKENVDTILQEIERIAGEKTESEIGERFKNNHTPKSGDPSPASKIPQTYEELLNWNFADNPIAGEIVNRLVDQKVGKK